MSASATARRFFDEIWSQGQLDRVGERVWNIAHLKVVSHDVIDRSLRAPTAPGFRSKVEGLFAMSEEIGKCIEGGLLIAFGSGFCGCLQAGVLKIHGLK